MNLKQTIHRIIPRKIWLQMMLVLIIVVTVPIISLAVLLITTGHKAVEQSVYRDYKEIATRASKEIGLFVKSPSDTLASTAAIIGVSPNDISRQELLLRELSLSMPIFTHISSTNSQGIEIASSIVKKGQDDFHDDPAFFKARDSGFYMSEIRLTTDNIPYIIMSVPIIHLGENHGVLISQVNMREMWNIVDGIKLGNTGHAFLMEQDRKIIAHPDKKMIFQYESLPGDLFMQIMSGVTGSMEYTDTLGASWVGSYASIPIPELKWTLVVRQDTTEAYLFSQKMKSHFKNMVIFGELIAILFAILLSQLMTRPIRALITATKRISSGDLEHKINSLRQDEIGRLSHSFDEMIEKLKRSRESDRLAVIGTLASSIAHEIKNPMVSISTFVQLLPERYNDPGFRDKFKTIVSQELNRINNILEELLTFVRPATPKFARTDVRNVMDRVLVLMEGYLRKYGIKVVKRYTDNLPELMADDAQLEQVFMNIVMNAIHAMQNGGQLTIITALNLRHVELKFEDTGYGIPPENISKIFDAFFSTKAEGTGLGLAISQKIVREHGGVIKVDSNVGIGTSFTVNLPLSKM